jgi:hypothetical protein
MTSAPRWLRDYGRLGLEYALMGAAGIPSALLYFGLQRFMPRQGALALAMTVAVVLGYCLRAAIRQIWVRQALVPARPAFSGNSVSIPLFPYPYAAATVLVITMATPTNSGRPVAINLQSHAVSSGTASITIQDSGR